MFDTLQRAPADPILGLTEAFNQDTNENKINLGVGVYQDEDGTTPVLACVKEAERRLVEGEATKRYKPISGDPRYGQLVQELVLGSSHPVVKEERAVTAHCPGGTGALRVAADFLARVVGVKRIWVSNPTWANHAKIFQAAGLVVEPYPYFDETTNGLATAAMLEALGKLPRGEVVLFHGCCHNPTGVDPSVEEWQAVAELMAARKLLPVIDYAYQGFGQGLDEDAQGVRLLCEKVSEAIICSSYSKNFGLYNERTGAATFVTSSADAASIVLSNVKPCIRANYSNPPAHGAAIVSTILADASLRQQWERELADMRNRINEMRSLFVETLKASGADMDCSFIMRQQGMFSMSGLQERHARALRENHSIYIVNSGRINVAGMSRANMDRLCAGIASVLSGVEA
jgi:aspartate/tyrosine/aromatic aminotransferase